MRLTVLTEGLASTSANIVYAIPAAPSSVRIFGARRLPTVGPVTIMTFLTPSFFKSSGIFRMLPTPDTGIGRRQ